MAKCKKKDYEYDCVQWKGDNPDEVLATLAGSPVTGPSEDFDGGFLIETQIRAIVIRVGDWVTRDPSGDMRCYTNAQFEAMHQVSGNGK